MFNVVIEKESHNKIDPLIITEDINLIVQSIEEQLYNINVSYRNNVRKIKNDLKLLTGVSESNLVILEDSDITNDNLISYLTNVLEISLDCVVSTLYEDNDYRNKLSSVNSLNDLLAIDHCNTPVLKNIVDHSNELFSVYSESNDIQPSTTTFYELLDSAIIKSIKNNQSTVVPALTEEEVIYQKVIENLDKLIDVDLTVTYDNIKSFTHSQVQVNENIFGAIWRFVNLGSTNLKKFRNAAMVLITTAAPVLGIGWVLSKLSGLVPKTVKDFDFLNHNGSVVRDVLNKLINKSVTADNITYEQRLVITNYISNSKNPIGEREFILKTLNDFNINNIEDWLKSSLSTLHQQIDNATRAKAEILSQIESAKATAKETGETLTNVLTDQIETINNKLQVLNDQLLSKTEEINSASIDLESKIIELESITPALENAKEIIANYGIYSAGIVGVAAIIYMVFAHYIGKRIFLTSNSADTIHAILALRKKIDLLRKDTLSLFPDLKIQFDQLDNEIIKCERDSTRQNDVMMAYQCSMKYFMGSYAIILFSVFSQLVKDGNNLNNFNTLASVHNFDGFASLKTRMMVKELNSFYTLMIDYDKTMIDSFEKIFYLVKQEILQNKSLSDITKRLPNQLALGKN